MKLSRTFIIDLFSIAVMFGLSVWAWGQLPPHARVPIHFDITGTPDK